MMRGAIRLTLVSLFLQTPASAFVARRRYASPIRCTVSHDRAKLASGRTLRVLRGGGSQDRDIDDKFEEGDYMDDSFGENEDDDYFDDEERDDEIEEADFEGDTLKGRAVKAWSAITASAVELHHTASGSTPPMTQAYVGASLALTIGAWTLNGNVWPEYAPAFSCA